MNAHITEVGAMRRAIALSALGFNTTSPNPPVGCVILDSTGQPVGEGYHLRKGEPHAEVHALAAAGVHATGGTAVVTLEPCNHYGRTPPCHQALVDAGVARVAIAVIDPTSRGVGGAARLRDAGLEVEVGLLANEARVVLGPWLAALDSQRPQVIWACDITGAGPEEVPDEVLAEAGLRCQFDAVVYTDGHVEEGAEGTHGQSAFTLPSIVPVTEPLVALSLLHQSGARTVLLHGGIELATSFLDFQLIDEVRMILATTAPSHPAPSAEASSIGPLTAFSIRAFRQLRGGVLIEASKSSSSDASAR
jgi:diaminohydroxyphosphoribosylaminopyrimidine deaminase/5-amino-6-(5-phosphoribosylamino)uracil reductase